MSASLPRAVRLQFTRRGVGVGAAGRGGSTARRPRAAVGTGDGSVAVGTSRRRAGAGALSPTAAHRLCTKRRGQVGRARIRIVAGARLCRRRAASDERALQVVQGAAHWRRSTAGPGRLGGAARSCCATGVGRTTRVGGRASDAGHAACGRLAAHGRLARAAGGAALPRRHRGIATDIAASRRHGTGRARRAAAAGSSRHVRLAAFTRVGHAAGSVAAAAVAVRAAGPDRTSKDHRHDRILKACPHVS
jgi:hypothetical protein